MPVAHLQGPKRYSPSLYSIRLCLAAEVAVTRGIRTLQILTLAENKVVQWLVRSMGVPYKAEVRHGEVTMLIHLPVA